MECSKEAMFEIIKNQLLQMGLEAKNDMLYYKRYPNNVLAVINLGIITIKTGESLSINPSVGIISEKVEEFMSEISGIDTMAQLIPTISTQLANLIPKGENNEWVLGKDKDNEAILKDLFINLGAHAFPFIEGRNNISALINEVENKNYISDTLRIYKMPLLYFFNGEKQKAIDFLNNQDNPNDPILYKLKSKFDLVAM